MDLVGEHNRRAMDLANRGRVEEAVAEWREALKIDPRNVPTIRNLGIAFLKLGRVEEAEEMFLEAVSLEPNNAHSHLMLGRTYLRQGKINLAEAELKAAQRLDPLDPDIDISLAVLAIRKGDYQDAESRLKRALAFNYKDPDIYAALGDVYRAKRDWERAEETYRSALALDAFHLGAKRGLQELETERHREKAPPEERRLMGVLRVENPSTRVEGGLFIVEGRVLNSSEQATAKYVTVTCQFYGPKQRIIAEKDTHPEPGTLGPGERGAWKLSVPYNKEFTGRMEIGVKAVIEDPEAERATREAAKASPPAERATYFGGDKVSRGDVLKVSLPKLATQEGKTVLRGYVLNVGDHTVASIDLNFRVVERQGGNLYTQQFARIDRDTLEPGEQTDYILAWQEGLDPGRFRLQMKIGWADLLSSPQEPGTEPPSIPPSHSPLPSGPSQGRIPTPMPEPLPAKPRD
jgi:Flp pilus assembly protein TadD